MRQDVRNRRLAGRSRRRWPGRRLGYDGSPEGRLGGHDVRVRIVEDTLGRAVLVHLEAAKKRFVHQPANAVCGALVALARTLQLG